MLMTVLDAIYKATHRPRLQTNTHTLSSQAIQVYKYLKLNTKCKLPAVENGGLWQQICEVELFSLQFNFFCCVGSTFRYLTPPLCLRGTISIAAPNCQMVYSATKHILIFQYQRYRMKSIFLTFNSFTRSFLIILLQKLHCYKNILLCCISA